MKKTKRFDPADQGKISVWATFFSLGQLFIVLGEYLVTLTVFVVARASVVCVDLSKKLFSFEIVFFRSNLEVS